MAVKTFTDLGNNSGFIGFFQEPRQLIMLFIACVLIYLVIDKKFEPLLPSTYIPGDRGDDGFWSAACKSIQPASWAAAQLGVFTTYLGAVALGFTSKAAAAIGIIGEQMGQLQFT
jgi:carboxybiotin decarboxylase